MKKKFIFIPPNLSTSYKEKRSRLKHRMMFENAKTDSWIHLKMGKNQQVVVVVFFLKEVVVVVIFLFFII